MDQNLQSVASAAKDGTKKHDADHTSGGALASMAKEQAIEHAYAIGKKNGFPFIDLTYLPINPDYLSVVDEATARDAKLVVFFRVGKKLRIALINPEDKKTKVLLDVLKQNWELEINVTTQDSLDVALKVYNKISKNESIEQRIKGNQVEESKIATYEKEIENLAQLKEKLTNISAEEALYLVNVGAIKTGASDIHYQPEEDGVKIRFRIDGLLQEIFKMDTKTYVYLLNQIKYKAKLKINVGVEPQDGRFSFDVNGRQIDVRISILPTHYGESAVCRILDGKKKFGEFADLGFEQYHLDLMSKASSLPNGMVLMAGPTGSGKTTTMYVLMNKYNQPENKIITLEDPIEYFLSNVSQSQIDEKNNYTFAGGLRAILRQDPDVIMVGEIRDLDTADTAAQAALTGHVLISSLHANNAVDTIPRLLNIGLPNHMIAPALKIVLAGRLVRKVCECRIEEELSGDEKSKLDEAIKFLKSHNPDFEITTPEKVSKAKGCNICSHTGYKGQVGIFEGFEVDKKVRDMILDGKANDEIYKYLHDEKGMVTMFEDGLIKVAKGLTTFTELQRVLRDMMEKNKDVHI